MRPSIFILILCFLLPACDAFLLGPEEQADTKEYLNVPPLLNDDIAVAPPDEEGLESGPLYEMITRLQQSESNHIRSILIARNNKLVLEAYFKGWHRDRRQDLRSASKSFVSGVMGIAIDKGLVKSVDEKIVSFFPEYNTIDNWDDRKAQMTIQDFIRMRTGLACNDRVPSSPGYQEKVYVTDDWIKFVLDLPVIFDPGQQYSYCSGAPIVLSAIVSKASGKRTSEFADEHLFSKLGIKDYVWEYMPERREYVAGQLHMRPRDFLKYGLLFANDGKWKGETIISSEWIAESTQPRGIVPDERSGTEYGYLWRSTSWSVNNKIYKACYAHGNGGQVLYVLKDLNMVIAFTGGAYNTAAEAAVYNLMRKTILPAVIG